MNEGKVKLARRLLYTAVNLPDDLRHKYAASVQDSLSGFSEKHMRRMAKLIDKKLRRKQLEPIIVRERPAEPETGAQVSP